MSKRKAKRPNAKAGFWGKATSPFDPPKPRADAKLNN